MKNRRTMWSSLPLMVSLFIIGSASTQAFQNRVSPQAEHDPRRGAFVASNTRGQRLSRLALMSEPSHVETLSFVECGFGADAHGQNATKASACRNAIEFNQIPSIADLVPGGRDAMKLDVTLAVPAKYQVDLDLEAIRNVFPYVIVHFQIQDRWRHGGNQWKRHRISGRQK